MCQSQLIDFISVEAGLRLNKGKMGPFLLMDVHVLSGQFTSKNVTYSPKLSNWPEGSVCMQQVHAITLFEGNPLAMLNYVLQCWHAAKPACLLFQANPDYYLPDLFLQNRVQLK